jgi:hypothetical protein
VKFLIDEDVPRSAADLLIERQHEVTFAVDVLLRGSDDQLLAKWAHEHSMTIVTCNYKHFASLLARPAYSQAGLVGLAQVEARDRLDRCIALIELEQKQHHRVCAQIRRSNVLIKHLC